MTVERIIKKGETMVNCWKRYSHLLLDVYPALSSLVLGTVLVFGLSLLIASNCQAQVKGKLRVSENHRYLEYEDGTPFFYLGDTAWELFHRLNREEALRYLTNRAEKGFTVIQAV